MADVFDTKTEGAEETKSYLEDLVGEGKKFKTVEDLAKGKLESDTFIEQLQRENQQALEALKELQGKQEDSATVSDLLTAVKEAQNKTADSTQPPLKEEDLVQLVRQTLDKTTQERQLEANRQRANDLVLERTGGDEVAAKKFVAEKASTLGMTPEALASLSETSPDAFAQLVGLTPKGSPQRGVSDLPGKNTAATLGQSNEVVDGHRTKAYYDRLKQEMGTYKFLNDKKLQRAYMQDAIALGLDKFNNSN